MYRYETAKTKDAIKHQHLITTINTSTPHHHQHLIKPPAPQHAESGGPPRLRLLNSCTLLLVREGCL